MSYARTAVTRMTLDMSRLDLQRSETVTLGDTNRRWEVTLINGGAPFRLPPNWTAALTGIKPDGTGLLNGCSVVDGKIVYDFAAGKEIATCVGYYPVQFDIWDEVGELVASPKLYVNVLEDVRPHAELESKGQYTLIGNLMGRVGDAEKDIESNGKLGNANAKKIEDAAKNISDNKDSIDLLATFVPNAERIILPKAAWTGDGKTPYKATLLTAREGCYVTIWASNADSYEWLNINRPTVSTEDGEVVISAAEKPKIDLEFIAMFEPYSTRESDEGTYSAYAVLVGLQDEADRLSLGKRMSAAEEKIKSAELIGGTVSIGAADWDKDKTTITLPLEPDTLTIMWPSDEVSAALIETNGLHINQSFVDVEKDTVLLLRGRAEDYNGKLTLKYVRVPYVTDKKDRPSVQLIGARYAAAGEGGNGGTIVSGAVPCKKITIAADGWSETKNMGLTTWIAGGIQLDDIRKSNLIRLLAANEETATDWSAGQVGAEITYNEEKKIYSLRVGIIGSKPSTDWQILLETLLVEESEDEAGGPYINVVPPVSDAVSKVADHNYNEMSHPNIRDEVIAIGVKLEELTKKAIDKTVGDLVNYYTKSQTLTKDEINALVSAIPKFKIEVVTSLPASNISETTVYLVKSGNDDSNLYTEYIYANSKWEKLGTQTVDLTGYATEAWVNDLIAAYVKTADMEAYVAGLLKAYITKDVADETYQPAGDYPNTDEMNEAISEATKNLAPKTLIPTKTSQLNNDSGYINQHQSIAHLLPKNQGVANAGKLMMVAADGSVTYIDIADIGLSGGDVTGVMREGNYIDLTGDIAKGTYTLTWTDDKGNTYDAGSLTVGKMYTVTANVTNCTVSNTASVLEGNSYSATVAVSSGHVLSSITVTMGGVDITATAVNGNAIYIAEVTGNVVITAMAEVEQVNYTNLADPTSSDWLPDTRLSSGGTTGEPGKTATNYVECKSNDEIRIKGLNVTTARTALYSSKSSAPLSCSTPSFPDTNSSSYDTEMEGTDVYKFKIRLSTAKFIRFSGTLVGTDNDVIITKNEPIE